MIYSLSPPFCFIHIPRTGGMSIRAALIQAVPLAARDDIALRHATGDTMHRLLGPVWDQLYRFTVVRSPWAIAASGWRLTLSHLSEKDLPGLAVSWRDLLERTAADPSFDRFIREEWLGAFSGIQPGGLWRTHCRSAFARQQLGIEAWRFERLADDWPEICRRIGIRPVELPHLNGAADGPPAPWTPDLVAAVGSLCNEDVRRFGYMPPEVMR